jgi:hypothetical protein
MLALTGCGSDAGGNDRGVASANDGDQGNGGGSDAPPGEDETHERMLAYAQCLRDQGLDVEDPAPGEGIQLQGDGDPSRLDAAVDACEDLSPPPAAGVPDEDEVRENMLEYATCMRDNGVQKFADPKPGEGIDIGPEVTDDPDFAKAEQTCRELLGGPESERQESRSS